MSEQHTTNFIADIAIIAIMEMEGEARARDLDIAERLGFSEPRMIRKLIKRNLDELQRYGAAFHRGTLLNRPQGGTIEVDEFWLNEPQALLIAIKSDAALAPDVREMLIRVFMAWRRGQSAPASIMTRSSNSLLEC